MSAWFKKKEPEPPRPTAKIAAVRVEDTWFGDLPLAKWQSKPAAEQGLEPWVSFARALEQMNAGDRGATTATLQSITTMSDLEPRHYLQAWHTLHDLGVNPPSELAKRVYAVVFEVDLDGGLDVLVAYSDHSARYLNQSGRIVIWERRGSDMDVHIDRLLEGGAILVKAIGPHEAGRPAAPPKGHARISMLTPSGIHFGQGSYPALSRDKLAAPMLAAGTLLLQALSEKALPPKS